MARCADFGHEVVALFLTRGEFGIPGKPPAETAAIRSAEAQRSCGILRAQFVFADQVDGHTELNEVQYRQFGDLLETQRPDVIFTHWPIDTHPDHRAASLLSYDFWLACGKRVPLIYYEVESGAQTQDFWPTDYVDISSVEARKRTACLAHASTVDGWLPLHDEMQKFRGFEAGCKGAEAFVCHGGGRDRRPLTELLRLAGESHP